MSDVAQLSPVYSMCLTTDETLQLLFQDAEQDNELRKKQEEAQREQALAQEAKRLEKVWGNAGPCRVGASRKWDGSLKESQPLLIVSRD